MDNDALFINIYIYIIPKKIPVQSTDANPSTGVSRHLTSWTFRSIPTHRGQALLWHTVQVVLLQHPLHGAQISSRLNVLEARHKKCAGQLHVFLREFGTYKIYGVSISVTAASSSLFWCLPPWNLTVGTSVGFLKIKSGDSGASSLPAIASLVATRRCWISNHLDPFGVCLHFGLVRSQPTELSLPVLGLSRYPKILHVSQHFRRIMSPILVAMSIADHLEVSQNDGTPVIIHSQ